MFDVCREGLKIKIHADKVGKSIEERWYRSTPEYKAEKARQKAEREAIKEYKKLLSKIEKKKRFQANRITRIRKSVDNLCKCSI